MSWNIILKLARIHETARPECTSLALSIRRDAPWSILLTFGPDCTDIPKGFRKMTTYCCTARYDCKTRARFRLKMIRIGEWRTLNRSLWSITKEQG